MYVWRGFLAANTRAPTAAFTAGAYSGYDVMSYDWMIFFALAARSCGLHGAESARAAVVPVYGVRALCMSWLSLAGSPAARDERACLCGAADARCGCVCSQRENRYLLLLLGGLWLDWEVLLPFLASVVVVLCFSRLF